MHCMCVRCVFEVLKALLCVCVCVCTVQMCVCTVHTCVFQCPFLLFPFTAHPNVTSSASQLITVDAGRRVGVVCAGSGTNDPQVQFLRDSTVLQSTTKYEVTSNSENHRLAYFLLHNTSLSDSGAYSCQALNFLSTTPSYFNISVVDPCEC